MSYVEKDFSSDFSKWLRAKQKSGEFLFTFARELKVCKKPRLNFTQDFQNQQLPCLLQTKHECINYKLSDLDVGKKPFDAFTLCYEPAYVVVLFYKIRKPKTFYFLDIDAVMEFMESNKSATEADCKKICDYQFTL
jgi:hypothetical protein